MIRTKISNYLARFLAIVVSVSLIAYILSPVNFAAGIGYVTWRSIALSNSNVGFTPTTLAAAITTTGQTSITVTSSANYPVAVTGNSSTYFYIQINNEMMQVTNVSGTTWTVTRGVLGTTAATASNGAGISGVVQARVEFVPATPASSIQAIVVDFCTDSPLYNASTCYTPSGMQIGASGATSLAVSGISGISSSLFTTVKANNYSGTRDDIIASNTGTGYVPSSATTLNGAITNSQTTITVTSSASYPAAVTGVPSTYFYITIGSETMQVTNVSGTTWTVTRAALGTSASIASNGAAISQPPIAFTVYGIMNPTSTGALYARIYTFNTYTSEASSFASSTATAGVLSPTTYNSVSSYVIDGGGVALYITNTLTVNAKVQEYLQFCIYTAAGSNAPCSQTGSTVTLGNSAGILSIANAYDDQSTRFDIATNASGYAAVTFTGSPLANGSNLIESSTLSGTGAAAATAYASSVGTDQFGLCAVGATTQATNYTTGNLSFPNPTYSGGGNCPSTYATSATYAGSATFGLNIAAAGSVYGDLLAVQQPGTGSTGLISFLGNVAASQLAGSYTTQFNFVATGTY
jgi:hypothetical protein